MRIRNFRSLIQFWVAAVLVVWSLATIHAVAHIHADAQFHSDCNTCHFFAGASYIAQSASITIFIAIFAIGIVAVFLIRGVLSVTQPLYLVRGPPVFC